MAAAESLIFGGARGPAKVPKESKVLEKPKEPKVFEKPEERKELKKLIMLKDPKAYGGTSIVVCNYFVLGVKAYGATSLVECTYVVRGVKAYGANSIVVCKATRPTSCGRRRSPSLGQAQECALLAANVASMVVLYNLPHTQPFSRES